MENPTWPLKKEQLSTNKCRKHAAFELILVFDLKLDLPKIQYTVGNSETYSRMKWWRASKNVY